MFEKKHEPIIPKPEFYGRLARYLVYSAFILFVSLGIGILGYHHFAALEWIDAFYNASMILTGMGPVSPMPDSAAKIFSGCYALFSSIAFLTTVATLFAPIVHRFLHLMHLSESDALSE
jgi:hypothetical protein